MKEIKNDELRTIQLDILQNVHDFCMKHDHYCPDKIRNM